MTPILTSVCPFILPITVSSLLPYALTVFFSPVSSPLFPLFLILSISLSLSPRLSSQQDYWWPPILCGQANRDPCKEWNNISTPQAGDQVSDSLSVGFCAHVGLTVVTLTEAKRGGKGGKEFIFSSRMRGCVCVCGITVDSCYLQPRRPLRINGFSFSILGRTGPYFLLILLSFSISVSISVLLELQEHAHRCFNPYSQLYYLIKHL